MRHACFFLCISVNATEDTVRDILLLLVVGKNENGTNEKTTVGIFRKKL